MAIHSINSTAADLRRSPGNVGHLLWLSLALAFFALFESAQGQFSTIINIPPDLAPDSIDPNSQLNIFEAAEIDTRLPRISQSGVNIYGGTIRTFISVDSGSTVRVEGGLVDGMVATDSHVNILGGSLLDTLTANSTDVIIRDGYVRSFSARENSKVNIFGGSVGSRANAISGSIVNVFGGSLGRSFDAYSDSEINIYGGTVESGLEAYSGSTVNIFDGMIDRFDRIHPGSTLNVHGGILDDVRAIGGTINVSDGFVDQIRAEGNTVVNLKGGSIERDLDLYAGSSANISGGSAGDHMNAFSGSRVEMSGGSIGDYSAFSDQSEVQIRGGTVGKAFNWHGSGRAELVGGDFRLNGEIYEGLEIQLANADVFTGRMKDGSVFLFSPLDRDSLSGVTLVNTGLPLVDTSPAIIDYDNPLNGITHGQSLTLLNGGRLNEDFAVVDATLMVEGGTVQDKLEIYGSRVQISAGHLGSGIVAHANSSVEVSGGQFGNGLTFQDSTDATIRGGTFGHNFSAKLGSTVELVGGEFMLNGTAFADNNISLDQSDILTGTLQDGSAFAFTPSAGDQVQNVTLTRNALPAAEPTHCIDSKGHSVTGLRQGQSLTLAEDGVLPDNFTAVGAAITLEGGTIGRQLELVSSRLDVLAGTVGPAAHAYANSVVNVNGGAVGSHLKAFPGSEVNVNGGNVVRLFAFDSSEVSVSAGEIGLLTVTPGSKIQISGGSIGFFFENYAGSEIRVSGGEFQSFELSSSAATITDGTFLESPEISGEVAISGGFFPDGIGVTGSARISGGQFGQELGVATRSGGRPPEIYITAWLDGELTLAGGDVNSPIQLYHNSVLRLVGTSFILDGVDITSELLPGIPFTVDHRDGTLEARLQDGSHFNMSLNSTRQPYEDYLSSDAALILMLVPEPSSLTMSAIFALGTIFAQRRHRCVSQSRSFS
ncbi:MAG: hypothetical protein AAGB04_09460 [Pseudomonadota bacterium]